MAGGTGSRLWPMSRALKPKQFLRLFGENTMLQSTANRLSFLGIKDCVTICNEEHRFFVAEQLLAIEKDSKIILEPSGRNTAPAIALAALLSQNDPLMLVVAADHLIRDEQSFADSLSKAIPLAESGKLVTFGVIPSEPNTGYGYIKKGKKSKGYFEIEEFKEKPNKQLAISYVKSNDYYWNSGMFLFKASRYLEELKQHRPDMYSCVKESVLKKEEDLDFIRIDKKSFESCPNESIDCAVMENTSEAVVVPMEADWSDIGSWQSLWESRPKDKNGNVTEGDTIIHNSTNSYIKSDGSLVVTIGVDNLLVVDTKDALLVANKKNIEEVKLITQKLKDSSRPEWESHLEVFRPWGKYNSIDKNKGYHVKRITVKPGAKLSVQKHNHRSEHWVVVSGEAFVTKGDETYNLSENESTYIPIGVVHSLENLGTSDLEIIEVQCGDYLGEDDIVRFEDIYGRKD